VEVLDSTACFTFYVFFVCDNECETVQVNVKVFMDFHRSLSLAHESLCGSSWATMSPRPSNNEGHPYEILPPNAVIAPSLNDDPLLFGDIRVRAPFRSDRGIATVSTSFPLSSPSVTKPPGGRFRP